MNKPLSLFLAAGSLLLSSPGYSAGPVDDFIAGELLIKFRPGATEAQLADAVRGGGLERVLKHFDLKNGDGQGITHVSTRLPVRAAEAVLKNHPAIVYAEPNYRLYPALTPNDPFFLNQWGLHNVGQFRRSVADADIDAPEAWNVTTGDPNIVIAVLDTGIDISHPDLAPNIWTNPNEVPNGLDDDGNGYVDDISGWDFRNEDNGVFDPLDGDYHGTHVAGIIGAVGNNSLGVAGVNWQCKILPLKFLGPEGGSVADAIEGIQYAVAHGAKAINASFGGGPYHQGFRDVIEASGILFVAAAGNYTTDTDASPFYPASYDPANLISVAATENRDRLATFSNYGATSVDLAAPGANIYNTMPGNSYDYLSGTSMAAPHVAGVAGLIYARYPSLTAAEVKHQILSSVNPLSALAGRVATGGRLNAARALVLVDAPPAVSINSPENGAVVSGLVAIAATATDNNGVTQVAFSLGATVLAVDTDGEYGLNWDSTTVADGSYILTATATDTIGQVSTHSINILVDNYNDAPIANAGPNQSVVDTDRNGSQQVALNGSGSTDPDGTITSYQWTLGATVLGSSVAISPTLPVGVHVITLTVTDDEGATGTDSVTVEVKAKRGK